MRKRVTEIQIQIQEGEELQTFNGLQRRKMLKIDENKPHYKMTSKNILVICFIFVSTLFIIFNLISDSKRR